MHRYWYACKNEDFVKRNLYDEKWIRKNKKAFLYSLKMIDNYLYHLIKKTKTYNPIILLTASMGQEARDDFSNNEDVKVSIDGKITDISKFLKSLSLYSKNT